MLVKQRLCLARTAVHDILWWWAILPKAEGVGICLYNVTATDFLTHNKRYILWVPQWFSEQILSDECI
jgi:hypothetical protein